MTARYELNQDGSVTIFFNTVLDFTCWQDGTPWKDAEEAEAWAQAYVAAKNDETLLMPPTKPNGQPKPQMTREVRINIQKLQMEIASAITDEEKQTAYKNMAEFMAPFNPNY